MQKFVLTLNTKYDIQEISILIREMVAKNTIVNMAKERILFLTSALVKKPYGIVIILIKMYSAHIG